MLEHSNPVAVGDLLSTRVLTVTGQNTWQTNLIGEMKMEENFKLQEIKRKAI